MQVVKKNDFVFYVSEKDQILVLTLVGTYSKQAAGLIEEMKEIVTSRPAKLVILNMRGLEGLNQALIPGFAQLQQKVRSLPAQLRLCGMKETVAEQLVLRGVIRIPELVRDLQLALEGWKNNPNK